MLFWSTREHVSSQSAQYPSAFMELIDIINFAQILSPPSTSLSLTFFFFSVLKRES